MMYVAQQTSINNNKKTKMQVLLSRVFSRIIFVPKKNLNLKWNEQIPFIVPKKMKDHDNDDENNEISMEKNSRISNKC